MKTSLLLSILSLVWAMPAAAGVDVQPVPGVPEPTAFLLFAAGAAVVGIGYRIGRNR